MKKLTVTLIFVAFFGTSFAQQLYFKGYRCSDDCSGHIEGYLWAKRNRISQSYECTGKSQSFIEGCTAWADGK